MALNSSNKVDIDEENKPKLGLGNWNVYFLIKFFLFWKDYIALHPLQNLAFAAFLLIPIKSRFLYLLRQWLAVPLGVVLFYYDSWLPPFHRVLSEAALMKSFDAAYMLELINRFVDVDVLALLVIIWVAYLLIGHYVRLGVLVVGYLIFMSMPLDAWLSQFGSEAVVSTQQAEAGQASLPIQSEEETINQYLSNFYAQEKLRKAEFVEPSSADIPFDILFIHLCSVSWEDLQYANQEDEIPLFDILLSNFSTAASYSGPAAIRVLRAGCGQSAHRDLYSDTDAQCYLFDSLRRIGFESELVMNHDGHFDDFVGVIQGSGRLNVPPMPLDGLPAPLRSFDGTPIYHDLETLERWLSLREQKQAPRVAALYNSISLHDGNRYTDHRSNMNSTENFVPRMQGLLTELKAFLQRLQASGRRVLVVMVPEHGAAIRGDKMQIAGLREIPSPAIALGPAGLRLIGPEIKPPLNPIRVDKPTSYFDISEMVARLLQANPFAKDGYDPVALVKGVQGTEFVAENAGTVVLRHQGKYYVRLEGSDEWVDYPAGG